MSVDNSRGRTKERSATTTPTATDDDAGGNKESKVDDDKRGDKTDDEEEEEELNLLNEDDVAKLALMTVTLQQHKGTLSLCLSVCLSHFNSSLLKHGSWMAERDTINRNK